MTEEKSPSGPPSSSPPAAAGASAPRTPAPRAAQELPDHPVRIGLLDLLADGGTLTSTEAAAQLGESSGSCSFHLRQLARHGLIEEAPHSGGRARPWRLRREPPCEPAPLEDTGFDALARGLEDESYRRWLAQRDAAPQEWRADEAFSTVVHLTPQEMHAVAEAVRQTLAGYRHREHDSAARPADARPVAFVSRLFPLLPGTQDGAE
ncbi:Helix-turn-helix domain-containing protein [Actinacidiphila yanglinensis]|uniref:Helix-turn-helix domain-containing protein n=1 Tax=Actinacidiphila yanglinensis TaxID=310779 RepID=A0A1H6EF77_9ACTN|nr:helix-turn-helix domain-containing protein [Actinacidiphila yanglinensis]SEG95921.1 Helix-turn-helix domain-containing protein [Actinacidiphila yanglinensis]